MLIDIFDNLNPPVFDLKNPETTGGVEENKVRILAERPDRHIEPAEIIVFQQIF